MAVVWKRILLTGDAAELSTNAPNTIQPDDAASAGTGTKASKDDHEHAIVTAIPVTVGSANAEGNSTSFSRANHVHAREHAKYTDASAKAAAVQAGAITNGVTKAPTHDAVFDVKTTADAATTSAEATALAKLVKLDDFATPDDNTDLNASTTRHGLLKKLDNVATNFLNGQGNFAVPAGGGGGGHTEGARVYDASAQTISNNTETAIAFDSERYDTDGIHDNSTNNSRLTCKTAGKYLIIAQLEYADNSTGFRGIRLKLNGSTYIGLIRVNAVVASTTFILATTIYDLSVNDYVEARAYQGSGGDLDVIVTANVNSEFMMQRIG